MGIVLEGGKTYFKGVLAMKSKAVTKVKMVQHFSSMGDLKMIFSPATFSVHRFVEANTGFRFVGERSQKSAPLFCGK